MVERVASAALPKVPGSRILRAADAEAWQHGFNFCARARRHAKEMEEAAGVAQAAERARGYKEGHAEGAAEATRLVGETTIAVDRYLASIESDVAELVMRIARQMLGEIDVADLVARLAEGALRDFRRDKWLTIKVHPSLVECLRVALGRREAEGGPTLTIVPDPRLAKDGCIVASEVAVVDAGIEAQLTAIGKALGIRHQDSAA